MTDDMPRKSKMHTVWSASGPPWRSLWYEHPFRTGSGKLRSDADVDRIVRKTRKEEDYLNQVSRKSDDDE